MSPFRIIKNPNKLMMSISVDNDIESTTSTTISQNNNQLLLKKDNDALAKDLIYHVKVASNFDYEKVKSIVEILESRYIPIQTSSFLSFALDGNWKHLYSNFPLPRKEPTL